MPLIEEVYKILFYIIYLLAKAYDFLWKVFYTWISYTYKVMHKTSLIIFILLSFLFIWNIAIKFMNFREKIQIKNSLNVSALSKCVCLYVCVCVCVCVCVFVFVFVFVGGVEGRKKIRKITMLKEGFKNVQYRWG